MQTYTTSKLFVTLAAVLACLAAGVSANHPTAVATLPRGGACYVSVNATTGFVDFAVSIVNITEITMVHIRRNRTGSDYEPVVNLYPLGSLSYPSPGLPKPLSRFTVVAGESYKIAGSFTELALLRDPLDNTAYALQDFINDVTNNKIYCAVHSERFPTKAADFVYNATVPAELAGLSTIALPTVPSPKQASARLAAASASLPASGFCHIDVDTAKSVATVTVSINTSEPIGGMYINSGRLPAGGEVGVELYPAIATLATYAPKSTITMVIPIDRASFITAVFPTFDKFAEAVAAYQVYCAVQTTNGRDLASGNFAAILPPAPPLPSNVGGSPSNGAASTNVTGTANSAAVAAPLALPLLALLLADLLL